MYSFDIVLLSEALLGRAARLLMSVPFFDGSCVGRLGSREGSRGRQQPISRTYKADASPVEDDGGPSVGRDVLFSWADASS